MKTTPIFGYSDYRQYLKDLTRRLKSEGRFNLRDFARRAGIRAPGYLKMVIDGRRNLKEKTVAKFSRALGLSGRTRIYFQKLVTYNQTADPNLKGACFDDLIALRPRASSYLLGKSHGRYFSRPHYVTIREMVALADFREDPKWIARRCCPAISPGEAREALKTLLTLGLIKRDETGKLVQAGDFVKTTDGNTEVIQTYHYHEAMLDYARHALGVLKQNERHFYALTLPLTSKMFQEIIGDFYKFRDQVVEKAARDEAKPEEVYQINFQLFPATRKKKEEVSS